MAEAPNPLVQMLIDSKPIPVLPIGDAYSEEDIFKGMLEEVLTMPDASFVAYTRVPGVEKVLSIAILDAKALEDMPNTAKIVESYGMHACRVVKLKAGEPSFWHSRVFWDGPTDKEFPNSDQVVHIPVDASDAMEVDVCSVENISKGTPHTPVDAGLVKTFQSVEVGKAFVVNNYHYHRLNNHLGSKDYIALMLTVNIDIAPFIPRFKKALEDYNGPILGL